MQSRRSICVGQTLFKLAGGEVGGRERGGGCSGNSRNGNGAVTKKVPRSLLACSLTRFDGRRRPHSVPLLSRFYNLKEPRNRQRERQTDRQGGIEGRLRKSSCLRCLRKFNLLENREDKLQTHSRVRILKNCHVLNESVERGLWA